MYSPYLDKLRLPNFIEGTSELPPYWIIPGFYCVNTQDNTLISYVVLTGTSPVKENKQNLLDLAYKLLEQNAFTFPIEIQYKTLVM